MTSATASRTWWRPSTVSICWGWSKNEFIRISKRPFLQTAQKCFDLGIDYYLTKPFSPKELIARIKAVLSRTFKQLPKIYKYETLEINFSAHNIKIDNKIINVTPKEYEILSYLIKNKDIAISREQLLSNVWGFDFFGDDRTVDTHIKMLRNNLGKYRDNIVTVRGFGYKYVEEKE